MQKSVASSARQRQSNVSTQSAKPRRRFSHLPLRPNRRKLKSGRFTCLPADLPPMTRSAFAVYVALSRYADNETQRAWRWQCTMAAELGCSARTVRRGVAELRALGLIAIDRTGRVNLYTLLEPHEELRTDLERPSVVHGGSADSGSAHRGSENGRSNRTNLAAHKELDPVNCSRTSAVAPVAVSAVADPVSVAGAPEREVCVANSAPPTSPREGGGRHYRHASRTNPRNKSSLWRFQRPKAAELTPVEKAARWMMDELKISPSMSATREAIEKAIGHLGMPVGEAVDELIKRWKIYKEAGGRCIALTFFGELWNDPDSCFGWSSRRHGRTAGNLAAFEAVFGKESIYTKAEAEREAREKAEREREEEAIAAWRPLIDPQARVAWLAILALLEKKIIRQSFETWLKPTRGQALIGEVLYVRVPTREFLHLTEKYGDQLCAALEQLEGFTIRAVRLVTVDEMPPEVTA